MTKKRNHSPASPPANSSARVVILSHRQPDTNSQPPIRTRVHTNMEYGKAVHAVKMLRNGDTASISFVTPIVSTCLAAAKLSLQVAPEAFRFTSDAFGYAENSGLRHHLGASEKPPPPGQSAGFSYCQIVKLADAAEVDACNRRIGSFLRSQLAGCANTSLVRATCGVVGELHDNIASHAAGAGFSAAQVYRGKRKVIQIGIVDCGLGLNGSVRRFGITASDAEAIEWCLARGNTTAGSKSTDSIFGPQRLPADCQICPYPDDVATRSRESHHMGEGLYRLTELIADTGGTVWIWSGHGQVICGNEARRAVESEVEWNGTAIEIEMPVAAFENSEAATSTDKFESLAKRLGL